MHIIYLTFKTTLKQKKQTIKRKENIHLCTEMEEGTLEVIPNDSIVSIMETRGEKAGRLEGLRARDKKTNTYCLPCTIASFIYKFHVILFSSY